MIRRVLLILAVALTAGIVSAAETIYAGKPLVDALRVLESKGLRLIYSSDVVRPEMVVREEPKAKEPRRVLDELLAQHDLRATAGPRGSLVIVRGSDGAEAGDSEKPNVAAMPVTSEEIVVMPSRFTLLTNEPEQRQFLSREDVQSLPHLSDDIYRAIVRVPGTAATDMSARFSIRGGDQDEVEVLIDGAEVYDPFHVKDLFRAFSTIDSEAVGAVEILTGGFPAQYGGRLSGVIEMSSLAPTEIRTEIGISLLNTRLLSSGVFNESRGSWVFSFRRGYLKELLKLIDDTDTADPDYYDLLGKLQYSIGDRHVISANVLMSRDRITVHEAQGADAKADYDDSYGWVNLRSAITPRLYAQTVVSTGEMSTNRDGVYDDISEKGSLTDRRSFRFTALKNDTTFDLTPRQALKAGVNLKQMSGSYDYDGFAEIDNTIHFAGPSVIERRAQVDASGSDISAYVADRVRLSERMVIEAGVRVDRQSYTPDGTHIGPRLNAGVLLGPRTALRAAWGRFYQPQAVNELQVEDGINEFHAAQRADHALIGLDHQFARGLTTRIEAYEKRLSNPRPRFENLFDHVILFPELRGDRYAITPEKARTRGVELLVRKDNGGPVSGWVSLVRSSAVDEIEGREVPRSWDQTDAVGFSVNLRRGTRWNFNVAGVYHTGWPTTNVEATFVDGVFNAHLGEVNADRLPAYKRVDFRASRHLSTSLGGFGFFLELFNALKFENVTRVDGFSFTLQPDGTLTRRRNTESVLQIVPSFGVTYQF